LYWQAVAVILPAKSFKRKSIQSEYSVTNICQFPGVSCSLPTFWAILHPAEIAMAAAGAAADDIAGPLADYLPECRRPSHCQDDCKRGQDKDPEQHEHRGQFQRALDHQVNYK